MHGLGSDRIPPERNNAVKAGEAFVAAFGTRGADIRICKDIPMGAGLGGSSADAAGVLNALAKLYGVQDRQALKALADTLGSAGRLKLICQLATGYDNVDIEYCKARGIRVVNARNYSTAAVVQHTVALALSVLENLPYYDGYVKSGAYAGQTNFTHYGKPFYELEGKTWGIVGMGNIGRRVAAAARALGCEVIFYSASGKSTCRDYEQVDFDGLLQRSDILSLHCPLSDRTRHLMDGAAFDRMKKEAVLINVARGAVVDTKALAQALLAGKGQAASTRNNHRRRCNAE